MGFGNDGRYQVADQRDRPRRVGPYATLLSTELREGHGETMASPMVTPSGNVSDVIGGCCMTSSRTAL
jgi:hypothetical protein